MHSLLFGGEVKLIAARPSTTTDMLTAPLYIVLKDYNYKYVKQQLIWSWQATNGSTAELENAMPSLPIAKLIIVDKNMTEVDLMLAAPSLNVHLEHSLS